MITAKVAEAAEESVSGNTPSTLIRWAAYRRMACSEFRVYAVFTRLKAELQTVSATFAHHFQMDGVACPIRETMKSAKGHEETHHTPSLPSFPRKRESIFLSHDEREELRR